ncbi:MAG: 6,7-dimethyl-8-ribityllumazine synthase [Chitinophagales bacterium]|nr:6,7-dimethyl-8-ribityllumazine synthase [Chitinophagales bacterium]MDW8419485.1 6,7-dimethyl-8-ribityllumazine synthase [Chitinophagales bacterium]
MYNNKNRPRKSDTTDTLKFKRVALIVSEYHSEITFALRDAARDALISRGIIGQNIPVYYVPGAYELPLAARWALTHINPDAVVCLGCVIKGETDHNVYINQAVAGELLRLSTETGIPVLYGVLTTYNLEQAQDRAGGAHGNKGAECAHAAVDMILLHDEMYRQGNNSIPNTKHT